MAADVLKLNRDKTDELLVIGHKVNPPIKGIHAVSYTHLTLPTIYSV